MYHFIRQSHFCTYTDIHMQNNIYIIHHSTVYKSKNTGNNIQGTINEELDMLSLKKKEASYLLIWKDCYNVI